MKQDTKYNCIYNQSLKLMLHLMKTKLPIVLYGQGGCGKTVLINEIIDIINSHNYTVYQEGPITLDLFEKQYIFTLYDLEKIKDIPLSKYYLVNMS